MTDIRHADWLSLIEYSGPFLAITVLDDAFPQGLDVVKTETRQRLRGAYDEWRDAVEEGDPQLDALHREWIRLVLAELLEYDGYVLKARGKLDPGLSYTTAEHAETITPDFAVLADGKARLLIKVVPPGTDLEAATSDSAWLASPIERMTLLCRASAVRIGLVTDGERWALVNAPVSGTTGHASWYARLWQQEPVTLRAFHSLLGVRRCFGPADATLDALLDESLKYQEEVTDTLGEQVRRAVEVLVQALDRADVDRNRELLHGVTPAELYEAGLTVMMRLVFVLCAEERGLLLLGDSVYDQCYAVSTLRGALKDEEGRAGPEVLERRHDAWSRLLAVFRAIYGGIEHESLRLPALGGSLFDPDRFPFLEGRTKGTRWRDAAAVPLPIDNRTVLLLLTALQVLEQRGGAVHLSYKALDVEQIGHVYEGLLEHTVTRMPGITLGLIGSQKTRNPNLPLAELESARMDGEATLLGRLKEVTGRSESALRNALRGPVEDALAAKVLQVSGGDAELAARLRPFANLLRTDNWGDPLIYRKNAFAVTLGVDRRDTGTHYTPKFLAENIVATTLEPVTYEGPSEGKPREEWRLNPPAALLDLKVCDPAMGSGAFLVQVCRWLAERLVEAWAREEASGKTITVDGEARDDAAGQEPLPRGLDERLLIARRLVAERCLYGVDVNPLAVELAKLSVWLVTLARGRPFGFLDHNLRSGDSLLGIHRLDQLTELTMTPGQQGTQMRVFGQNIQRAVQQATELRQRLRRMPIRDIRDVEAMAGLDAEARHELEAPERVADCLVGEAFRSSSANGLRIALDALAIDAQRHFDTDPDDGSNLSRLATDVLGLDLPAGKPGRRPFHWPLEFPEVFGRNNGGFDAIVGNPPFLGGQKISGAFGTRYLTYLTNHVTYEVKASVDLVVYFFNRMFVVLRSGGSMGLLARRSISEGRNRDAGLRELIRLGGQIYCVKTNIEWPGKASVVVHQIHIVGCAWTGPRMLNSVRVSDISADLSGMEVLAQNKLFENHGRVYQGTILLGEGFKIDEPTALEWIKIDKSYEQVLRPFIGGNEVNGTADASPQCWVINFWDWPRAKAEQFPLVFKVAEELVKPVRDKNKRASRRDRWWVYGETAVGLYRAIGQAQHFSGGDGGTGVPPLKRVLAISTGVSKFPAFTFLPTSYVFSNKLCIVADSRYAMLAILSSDIHGVWAWAQKTSMGGDLYSLVYAHGNIFETFPFPECFLSDGDGDLEKLGEEFFHARQKAMVAGNMGLTEFYNKFHDQEKNDESLKNLRELQGRINNAVCGLYGWNDDLDVTSRWTKVGYLPDGSNTRFAIGERERLEILRRLSQLNRERHNQESEAERQESLSSRPGRRGRKVRQNADPQALLGFLDDSTEMD